MALLADLRAAVKVRVDIGVAAADTSFDTIIDQFINDMVKRLYPQAQDEVPMQTVSISPDFNGQAYVDLSALGTVCEDVRLVEAVDSSGEWPVTNIFVHAMQLRLRRLNSDVSQVHIFGLTRFTLATLSEEFELPLIYYAVSEFYNHLVGDKRLYNQYMANGRPAVDNMKDLADEYEAKAQAVLEEKAIMYGRS